MSGSPLSGQALAALRRAACALASIGTVAVLSSASAAAAESLSVALAPMAAASAPQGAAFTFTAHLTSSEPVTQEVVFDLVAPNGATESFLSQLVAVPPGLPIDIQGTVATSQWFKELGRYKIVPTVGGRAAGAPLAFMVTKAGLTVPRFADVTRGLGLATDLPTTTCGRWSNGAAWGDVDRNGTLDLYVTRGVLPAQLFVNRGKAGFVEEGGARGVSGGGTVALGAVFADYDNDADQDLLVTNDGPPRLYRNDGTGHFADVTAEARIGGDYMGMSGSWADYDADGHLDLYVTNHSRCAPTSVNRGAVTYNPDLLWHSNGDGTFTDATALLEHDPNLTEDGSTIGAGFQAAWFDYNGDNRQDLYLANDFLGQRPDRNHLWRNDGRGPDGQWQFTDVSIASGTSLSMNSMGIGVGDYDRDLDFDLVISNWGPNRLLRNNGDGSFRDVGPQTRIEREFQRQSRRGVTWGPQFADFNLDGWEDLYIAAGYLVGYLTPEDTPQRNEVFVNDRKGQFLDLSAASGADDPGQSRGVATADYDRDGRVDVYVVNQGGGSHLFRNVTPKGKSHWLEVRATGTRSNRDACGTKMVLTVAGGSMLRQVFCGSTSTNSGSDKVVHFGVGTAKKLTKLEVTWPTGIKQVFRKLKLDKVQSLVEPRV